MCEISFFFFSKRAFSRSRGGEGGGGRLISYEDGTIVERRGGGFITLLLAWNNRRNARVVNQLPLWRVRISWQRPRDPGSSGQDLWIVFECARARSCTLRKARNARSSRHGGNERGGGPSSTLVFLGKESRLVSRPATQYTSLSVKYCANSWKNYSVLPKSG